MSVGVLQQSGRVEVESNGADRMRRSEKESLAVFAPAAAVPVSGLYTWKLPNGQPFTRAELRFDVDGPLPLQVASGTEIAGLTQRVDWIARPLTAQIGPEGIVWTGPITYRNGDTFLFQYSSIRIERNGQLMRVTLVGGGPDLVRDFKFSSSSFRPVEFEFDAVEGVTPVLKINTHDHPDRPGSLPNEELSIESVFQRAGFDVRSSGADSIVPLDLAGADEAWSDAEMHDAMQSHFSRFANKPQWSLWTLFAALHIDGTGLGGIMFDFADTHHRQGTALFLKSFIANAPAGDTSPEAWVRRMAFWTVVHEMGHAFNLAHSWEKHRATPWMPMASNFDLLTYMNYPYLYQTGTLDDANTVRFFRDFDFRFSDEELLFLRHAPEEFVQMGNADWGMNHAFEQADVSPVPRFRLSLRINRPSAEFEFLEPVVIELKLTNVSGGPCLVPDMLLKSYDQLIVLTRRNNDPARTWHPHAHHCWRSKAAVLNSGESLYESLFLSAGHDGWLVSDPGRYRVQACLHLNGEDVVSEPLTIRVTPPRGYDEEYLAQDYFEDKVGRVLAFDGSRCLEEANDTLRELADRFAEGRAAIHARVALGMPNTGPFKSYEPAGSGRNGAARPVRSRIDVRQPDEEDLRAMAVALGTKPESSRKAAEALGHIDYRYYAELCAEALAQRGQAREAQEGRELLYETLVERRVLPRVIDDVRVKFNLSEEEERKGRGTGRSRPSKH